MSELAERTTSDGDDRRRLPVRGALEIAVTSSNPETTAGTDFSIFVVIRNPYDIPVTLHEVQTHIPVELVDVNQLRLAEAALPSLPTGPRRFFAGWRRRRHLVRQKSNGIAIAVGTEFSPEQSGGAIASRIDIGGGVGDGVTIAGVQLVLPTNPSPEELDRLFRRLSDYHRGVTPITLQPGDSVVRQFVLRTRSWLLFRPLAHTFEIQVTFALESIDHTTTVAHSVLINAPLPATAIGGLFGSAIGAALRALTTTPMPDSAEFIRALLTGTLASVVVVVAFARKAAAQPFVTIEDFWGGALIGVSVGYFGFESFSDLLTRPT